MNNNNNNNKNKVIKNIIQLKSICITEHKIPKNRAVVVKYLHFCKSVNLQSSSGLNIFTSHQNVSEVQIKSKKKMFLLKNYHISSPHLFHIFLNSHLLYEITVAVEAERVQSRSLVDHEEPTGAGEKLLDLLVFWHVLNGRVDLLSDRLYGTLPFYVTVTSIQQPVCKHTHTHVSN